LKVANTGAKQKFVITFCSRKRFRESVSHAPVCS